MPLMPPPLDRLDHDLYEHRPSAAAPGRAWPGGRAAAAFVLLRVQSLELDPPEHAQRDPRWRNPFGDFRPDYRAQSLMEYGNRIGVFRLLDLLQPLGWHVAVSVNGLVAHQCPGLVRELQARGVDIVMGGWSASRLIDNAVPPEIERAWLKQSCDAIADAIGQLPGCYASQDYGYSDQTPQFLDQLGIGTAVDWPNDERPFLFGQSRRLVMLPAAAEMEDAQMLVVRRLQSPVWARHLLAGLRYWAEPSAAGHTDHAGRVLALPLHAWISGAPHRFTPLERALKAFDASHFWQAGPQDIASAWRGLP